MVEVGVAEVAAGVVAVVGEAEVAGVKAPSVPAVRLFAVGRLGGAVWLHPGWNGTMHMVLHV